MDLPAGIVFGYAEPSTPALMEAVVRIIAVARTAARVDPDTV